jgi:hypothetical protein
MSVNNLAITKTHEEFIAKIVKTSTVWCLENEEGVATTGSTLFENEDNEPVDVLCFWSEKSKAQACANGDWKDYSPTEIPLAEFIENWCVGMSNDGIMAGTDFDTELEGFEADTLELILEIAEEIKNQNTTLDLANGKSLDELVNEVNDILNLESDDEE